MDDDTLATSDVAAESTEALRERASEAVADADAAFLIVIDDYDPDAQTVEGRQVTFSTTDYGMDVHAALGDHLLTRAVETAMDRLGGGLGPLVDAVPGAGQIVPEADDDGADAGDDASSRGFY